MDVLTDSLRSLRMTSEVYGRLELTAPWGLELELGHPAFLHAVVRGGCVLEVAGDRIPLATGDWVFILGGTPHVLVDAPGSRSRPLPDVYEALGGHCGGVLHHGGGGQRTTLVSASFGLTGAWVNPVLAGLPQVLHVRGDDLAASPWVAATIQLLASEMEAERPGHEVVANRLADVLFVHALRAAVETLPARSGWLRALEDPQLGPVLERLHERPGDPWTVEQLARVANTSRSTFAAHFRSVLGEPPLAYLTRWRMHAAIGTLVDTDESLATIAHSVGYETDSAFGKAFKRHVGQAPGDFRRRARAASAPAPRESSRR